MLWRCKWQICRRIWLEESFLQPFLVVDRSDTVRWLQVWMGLPLLQRVLGWAGSVVFVHSPWIESGKHVCFLVLFQRVEMPFLCLWVEYLSISWLYGPLYMESLILFVSWSYFHLRVLRSGLRMVLKSAVLALGSCGVHLKSQTHNSLVCEKSLVYFLSVSQSIQSLILPKNLLHNHLCLWLSTLQSRDSSCQLWKFHAVTRLPFNKVNWNQQLGQSNFGGGCVDVSQINFNKTHQPLLLLDASNHTFS